MNWPFVKHQLEQILHVTVQFESWRNDQLDITELLRDIYALKQNQIEVDYRLNNQTSDLQMLKHQMFSKDGNIYYCMDIHTDTIDLLKISGKNLSDTEKKLMHLLLETTSLPSEAHRANWKAKAKQNNSLLKNWITEQLQLGIQEIEVPFALSQEYHLHLSMIPVLVVSQHASKYQASHHEIQKLLDSFFEATTIVVALQMNEWIILLPEQTISLSQDHKLEEIHETTEQETIEHKLSEIAAGMQDILWSEGIAECHLAIHKPIIPRQQWIAKIWQLRESMMIGKAFHHQQYIHMPWKLTIEKLLYSVPEQTKIDFIHHVLQIDQQAWDEEIMLTVYAFFDANCNVSHTAKKLYIHRNTLLYRLDKFRQLSGWDVRVFEHAVFVKLALLLYKMTK